MFIAVQAQFKNPKQLKIIREIFQILILYFRNDRQKINCSCDYCGSARRLQVESNLRAVDVRESAQV